MQLTKERNNIVIKKTAWARPTLLLVPRLRREIQPGIFTKKLGGIFIIGFCGIYLIWEVSEMVLFLVELDYSTPLFPIFVPINSLIFWTAPFNRNNIADILSEGAQAKITPAIVQAIMVDVVHD